MKKLRGFIIIFIFLVSIILIISIGKYILDNTGKINQGNFRMNDIAIQSEILVAEKKIDESKELTISNMMFDLSLKNTISMLIANDAKANNIYIDNIRISNPKLKGEIKIGVDEQNLQTYTTNTSKIDLYPQEQEGEYLCNLVIKNENFAVEQKVPSETKEISYSGKILNLLQIKTSDLYTSVSFDINVIDESGKHNKCSAKYKVPDNTLITEGISIVRKETKNLNFTIQNEKNT